MGWVYILECRDGSLYVGSTNDLKRRIEEHRKGIGSRYVRGRRPFKVVYVEETDRPRKREYQLKRLFRQQKLKLIQENWEQTKRLLEKYGIDM